MILNEHLGLRPRIDPTAYVAPNAGLSGDVRVGKGARVLFGAVITAEGGLVDLGDHTIVMEGALVRGTKRHPARIGKHVLVGPHAYLVGCTVGPEVFIATGATVFNGAVVEPRSEIRIHGTVHVNSRIPEGATVPIGWVAVGAPAKILPPGDHEAIWNIQEPLDFPGTVFGLERPKTGESVMPALTERYGRALGRHQDDQLLSPHRTRQESTDTPPPSS